MELLDIQTIRELWPYSEKEIEEALAYKWIISDPWRLFFSNESSSDYPEPDIFARALTYGEKKYPDATAETAIFASIVEEFSVSYRHDFTDMGPDLHHLALNTMVTASSILSYDHPIIGRPMKVLWGKPSAKEFTLRGIDLLAELIYGDNLRFCMAAARLAALCPDGERAERAKEQLFEKGNERYQ